MERENLAENQSFINWATGQNEKDVQFWDNYLANHPEKASEMMHARGKILSGRNYDLSSTHTFDLNFEWENVQAKILTSDRQKSRRKVLALLSTAAAILLLFYIIFPFSSKSAISSAITQIDSTKPGEIRTITLSDGTLVTLNGNSSITYPQNLDKVAQRLVSITGEVYFEVQHNDTPFRVDMNHGKVTVLGTKFNVNARTSQPRISLVDGKVNVQAPSGEELILLPGQSADIGSKIRMSTSDVVAISSWKDHLWTFKNTPLTQLIEKLHDDFGITVHVSDTSIKNRVISGNLYTENLDLLYKALETMLDIRIEQGKQSITLLQK
ncbi:MAG: FecR domain-containing protein [Saprospiraceae bacterium]|nr:FecR domain-containing protein [Saprospiraceae bacterium]